MKYFISNKWLLLLALSLIFVSYNTHAQLDVSEGKASDRKDKYFSYLDIPLVLIDRNLEPVVSRKNYLAFLTNSIERATPIGLPIRKEEVEALDEELIRNRVDKKLSNLLPYDLNRDQILDEEEIRQLLLKKLEDYDANSNYRESLFSQEFKNFRRSHDRNDDGIVDYQEMSSIWGKARKYALKNSISSVFREYFWLDPTKDGVLTVEDIHVFGNKAFNTLDLNSDNIIDEEEYNAFQEAKISRKGNSFVTSSCSFENVDFPEDMRVYAVYTEYKKLHSYTEDDVKEFESQMWFQVNVQVSDPDHPVALIFSHPKGNHVWNVEASPGTEIVAVLYHENGTYKEKIRGLGPETKIFANYPTDKEGYKRRLCGSLGFSLENPYPLNAISRQFFDKPVDMLFTATSVGEYPVDAKILDVYKKNKDEPVFKEELFKLDPDKVTLKDDIDNGLLRLSTLEDYELWAKTILEKETAGTYLKDKEDIPPIANFNTDPYLIKTEGVDEIYTLLEEYRCPDPETLNDKKISFIIEKRTPPPKGSFCQHYWIYNLSRLKCSAPAEERSSSDICIDWHPPTKTNYNLPLKGTDPANRGVDYLRIHKLPSP